MGTKILLIESTIELIILSKIYPNFKCNIKKLVDIINIKVNNIYIKNFLNLILSKIYPEIILQKTLVNLQTLLENTIKFSSKFIKLPTLWIEEQSNELKIIIKKYMQLNCKKGHDIIKENIGSLFLLFFGLLKFLGVDKI